MHKPIREHLEAYLTNARDPAIPQDFHSHLAGCSACQEQIGALAGQSQQLRAFRDTTQLEPQAGFYARVLNRIEEQKPDSFWSVFLGPVLGGRLAYSCAALVLVLGTYLVTSEKVSSDPSEQVPGHDIVVVSPTQSSDLDGIVQSRDRDAVLVNLASFRE